MEMSNCCSLYTSAHPAYPDAFSLSNFFFEAIFLSPQAECDRVPVPRLKCGSTCPSLFLFELMKHVCLIIFEAVIKNDIYQLITHNKCACGLLMSR